VLVLSRKPGTKVLVDGKIRITILEIRGGQVTIGIEAPEWVRVVRDAADLANSSGFKHIQDILP
jgi:carbon storage regulator CsrA